MNYSSVLKELTDCTKTWIDLASEIYGRKFVMPSVSIALSGAVAGRACYSRWMLKFNPDIYSRHQDDFSNRTVPHEIAHLIAYVLNAGKRPKPHGFEWQQVMIKLGVKDATRCHHYNIEGLARRRERPYIYSCSCAVHRLTSILHKRIQQGQTRTCNRCRMRVVFVREAAA